nr:class I SAM-dependent methyltransferase [Arsenicicoccus piscis]
MTLGRTKGRRTVADHIDVTRAFDAGAGRYDVLVASNPGYHASLAAAARQLANRLRGLGAGPDVIDLGCGTGASTKALVQALGPGIGTITGIDASQGMLDRAVSKTWPAGVRFRQGRAQDLPALTGATQEVDGVFMAYLLRNVPDSERDSLLRSVFDQLRPGGWCVLHEYSVAGRPAAIAIWGIVCWLVVIPLGTLTGGGFGLYRYLWRSVLDFDTLDTVTWRLHQARFVEVQIYPTRGWTRGVLHTVVARRPR